MKRNNDPKQAFYVGTPTSRSLSRKELEEQKKKEEEEAAAHVFQEFVETFQEAPIKTSKVWIKAGTYDAGARKEDTSERGKLYKPQSRMETNEKSSAERAQEYVKMLASKPDKPTKKRDKDKKKSNLELFKEELRQIQEEREERHKYKGALKSNTVPEPEILPPFLKDDPVGSFDFGDPNTTNLYLGNLSPKLTEQQLMEIFGRYGPLASIKIMWPRSEEEKARGRNCGFVAYMCRKDGERALRNLNGKEIMQCEMKMGWGKAVVIPQRPIYIPPSMLSPPPLSGLPFNAQAPRQLINKIPRLRPGEAFPTEADQRDTLNKILSQSIVKVVIPKERQTLMIIHRMVEFVIREGPMFEAMIMNKEINNPQFRFLFENQSPNHVYYRWKLFSLLQGDSPNEWNTNEFRMFKGGSIWRPPGMNVYTQGMPEYLIEEDDVRDTKGSLSKTQRERLEDLIRQLTPERWKVGEAMVFCIEHADAAEEISDCLAESLSMCSTAPHKKAARVYLISDVLHNCSVKMSNVTHFRRTFESRLLQIMNDIHKSCERQDNPHLADGLRARVQNVLRAWLDWNVYPREFISRLHKALNGIEIKDEISVKFMDGNGDRSGNTSAFGDGDGEDIDGDDAEEGGPLDGAALLKAAQGLNMKPSVLLPVHTPIKPSILDDIDGIPMDEDIDGVPLEDSGPLSGNKQSVTSFAPVPTLVGAFVPSKWESVGGGGVDDMEEEEEGAKEGEGSGDDDDAQSDRDSLPLRTPPKLSSSYGRSPSPENNDSNEVSDERRQILRSVELRAVQYQDELESGQRQLRPGWTMQQQVQHFRRKLLKKTEREAKEKDNLIDSPERIVEKKSHRDKDREREKEKERDRDTRARSGSSEEGYNTSNSSNRKSKRSRDISLSPPRKSRHRSRSPVRKSRSSRRSPSPPSPPSMLSYHSSSRRSSESSSSSRKHKHKHKY